MSVGAASAKRARAPLPLLAVLHVTGPGISSMSLGQHKLLVANAQDVLRHCVSAVIGDTADVRAALDALLSGAGAGSLIVVVGEDVSAAALAGCVGDLRLLVESGALRVACTPWLSQCLREKTLLDVPPPRVLPAAPAAAAAPRLVATRVPGLLLLLDCISPAVERTLFESALFEGSLPKPNEAQGAWFARMDAEYRASSGKPGSPRRRVYGEELPPARWPRELLEIFSAAVRAGVAGGDVVVRPDSVHPLLYSPGAKMPAHCDSWHAYGGYIFGISLGASATLQMTTNDDGDGKEASVAVKLPRRSVYAMTGAARRSLRPLPEGGGLPADAWRHAITEIKSDHDAAWNAWNALGLRASITLRVARSTEAAALLELRRQADGGGLALPPPPPQHQLQSQLDQSEADGPQRDEFWKSTGGSVMKWDRRADAADRGGRLSIVPTDADLRERLSAGAAQPLAWWRDA